MNNFVIPLKKPKARIEAMETMLKFMEREHSEIVDNKLIADKISDFFHIICTEEQVEEFKK